MRRLGQVIPVCAAVLALAAPNATAAATRSEYAAQVNPICADANTQVEQVYAQLTRKLRKLDQADNKKGNGLGLIRRFDKLFAQTSRRVEGIYAAELTQIAPIAPAPGDEALVASWFGNRTALRGAVKRLNRVSEEQSRLFITTDIFDPKTVKREKRLQRKSSRLLKQYTRLAEVDLELGTQLGVNYCVTGATGTITITTVGGSTKG